MYTSVPQSMQRGSKSNMCYSQENGKKHASVFPYSRKGVFCVIDSQIDPPFFFFVLKLPKGSKFSALDLENQPDSSKDFSHFFFFSLPIG